MSWWFNLNGVLLQFKIKKVLITILFMALYCPQIGSAISDADYKYLYGLAGDTWNCISYYVDPDTGIPYDNSNNNKLTGIDKIGFYIASTAVAEELKLINRTDAISRVNKTLNTLLSENFETWNGSGTKYESPDIRMPYAWYDLVSDETPNSIMINLGRDKNVSTYDLGNYYACLIVGRNAFPELNRSFSNLLDDINWHLLYDEQADQFYNSYNLTTGYSEDHCEYLGSESRIASFLGIATESIPPEHWEKMSRSLNKSGLNYNHTIYEPGWRGGLFTQFLPGIFIDERHTPMGHSAKEFMRAQIAYAVSTNKDVWGWSPCYDPDGKYIGYDEIEGNLSIVTPHASALAIIYDPQDVVKNLQRLEENGVRKALETDLLHKKGLDFGFRDSIDLNSGRISDIYLTIDQAMIFLSIANYLNGTTWRLFMNDSISKNGINLIEDYREDVIYFAEGESAKEQTGGSQDNASWLGGGWGDNEDYAKYEFNLSDSVEGAQLKIKYSDMFDEPSRGPNLANNLSVYLDGKNVGTLYSMDTGNWYTFKWSDNLYIGNISEGQHELKLVSKDNRHLNCVNIDCIKLFLKHPEVRA